MTLKKAVWLWGPVALWAGLIFYLSHLPYLRITPDWWDYPARKIAHMVEYGVLARLIARALGGSTDWRWKRIVAVSLALTIGYACSDEIHQRFVPGRHGSPRDLIYDTAGAVVALSIKI